MRGIEAVSRQRAFATASCYNPGSSGARIPSLTQEPCTCLDGSQAGEETIEPETPEAGEETIEPETPEGQIDGGVADDGEDDLDDKSSAELLRVFFSLAITAVGSMLLI